MNEQLKQSLVSRDSVTEICSSLKARGFTVYLVGEAKDSAEFFAQVKTRFPLDPPISGNVHWDAFADSLWGGLDACPERKIALIVEDATEFRETNKREFEIAMECLVGAAGEVEAEKRIEGDERTEIVVFVGIDEP